MDYSRGIIINQSLDIGDISNPENYEYLWGFDYIILRIAFMNKKAIDNRTIIAT